MKTRLLTAAIALPILIGAIILPIWLPWAVWIFVAIAVFGLGAGLFEFYILTKKLELKADAGIAYLGAAALTVSFIFDAPTRAPEILFCVIAAFIIAVFISQAFRFQKDFTKLLAGLGVTIAGVFYLAFIGGFLISVRLGFDNVLSSKLLFFFFAVIFGSDAGAYFAGRAFGKHKLAPAISPGKTVEGLIGGILAAAGFASLVIWLFFAELAFLPGIAVAIGIAVLGVFGDLAESAIKRGSGAKDAASILPGHGGFLDRLDSLLFGAPVLYYFARFYFG
ncbi:MAG: phosphatidate cytidylyltransferase [Acidobacteria bacterium]|nr:phosphatidate cytidylyltransferase [Acidobacteriota bacterium]